jgi:O-antigen ligase
MKRLKLSLIYLYGLSFVAGIALPLSTAVQNLSLPLIVLTTILNPRLRQRLPQICLEPAILACLGLYALLLFGCVWSVAPVNAMLKMLIKMIGLVELPFIAAFLSLASNRKGLYYGFASGCIITLVVSYFSLITNHPLFHAKEWGLYYGIFRAHTYHCYFLAIFGCYLSYQLLQHYYLKTWQQLAAIIILGAILYNIFFETYSRSGQILTLLMFILVLIQWRLKPGIFISLGILFVIVPALIYLSPAVSTKIKNYQENIVQYQRSEFESSNPSMYLRWTFHKYAKMLIQERPLYGYGTGSYPSQYQRISAQYHNPFGNTQPHNDYLWFGAELGYIGIIALVAVLGTIFIRAFSLDPPYKNFMLIIIVSYAISCLENSYLTDTVSGLAFIVFVAVAFASKYQVKNSGKL